jgi:hypothetical protein
LRVVTRGHVAEGGEAGLDGVGVALVHLELLDAVNEELREGDGAEGHGLEVLQVGGRRLHPPSSGPASAGRWSSARLSMNRIEALEPKQRIEKGYGSEARRLPRWMGRWETA